MHVLSYLSDWSLCQVVVGQFQAIALNCCRSQLSILCNMLRDLYLLQHCRAVLVVRVAQVKELLVCQWFHRMRRHRQIRLQIPHYWHHQLLPDCVVGDLQSCRRNQQVDAGQRVSDPRLRLVETDHECWQLLYHEHPGDYGVRLYPSIKPNQRARCDVMELAVCQNFDGRQGRH